jgi:hypothetical protein
VTPEEFAASTGLTLEEAQLILARRAAPVAPVGGRLALALKALSDAVRKTGVAPVRVGEGGVLEKSEALDPEALDRFYKTHTVASPSIRSSVIQGEWLEDTRPKRAMRPPSMADEDVSQDPEDY